MPSLSAPSSGATSSRLSPPGNAIGEWPAWQAARFGDKTAVVDATSGRRVGYRELDARAVAVAAGLTWVGVRSGDRVALLMDNSAEFLEVVFGVAKAGAVLVPINFRLAAPEVAYVLGDSGASVLVVSQRWVDLAESALLMDGVVVTSTISVGAGVVGQVPCVDLSELAAADPGAWSPPEVADDDVAVIMYTSGTTGRPKGAMLTHTNLLWNAINILTGPGLNRDDVAIAVAPLFHIGALNLSALPLVYIGGTTVTQQQFDPEQLLELVTSEAATTLFLVPAMWATLAKTPGVEKAGLDKATWLLAGGAPCPLSLIEFYRSIGCTTFFEGFGMTETAATALLLDADRVASHSGSVGRQYQHMQARIVDGDGQDVPVGAVGEVILRGRNIFVGYWNRPDATAETLRDGWMFTGDLGRADAEGMITLVDRKKDMIITGGENVYPIEVERLLQRHPSVDDVAVIGVPDEQWGERVVAVVVQRDGADATSDDLIAFARDQIARFKIPKHVMFVDELPRTASGKVLKRTLREQFGTSASAVSR